MSKAFTREEEGGPEPLVPIRHRSEGPERYLTPEGHQGFEAELAALQDPAFLATLRELPPLEADALRRTRERRARQLVSILDSVEVVPPPEGPPERVVFGAWVTLEDEEGRMRHYRLVGPDEADPKTGALSVESPLARALLGRAPGEGVLVELPRGPVEYTLTSISYRPS